MKQMQLLQDFLLIRTELANNVKYIIKLSEIQITFLRVASDLFQFKETDEWKNYQYYIN